MAFWDVHAPLGGLSLSAASRGREGWWAPPLPLHGHVKVAFYRETPEGVRRGGWHGSSGDKQGRKAEHERRGVDMS